MEAAQGKTHAGVNGDAGGDGEGEAGAEGEGGKDKGGSGGPVDLGPAPKFDNKEDAVAAFKELLESKCTSHKMTWAELVPLVSNDPRWRAVKSTGEKKNLFQHLMAQKQRDAIDQVPPPLGQPRQALSLGPLSRNGVPYQAVSGSHLQAGPILPPQERSPILPLELSSVSCACRLGDSFDH